MARTHSLCILFGVLGVSAASTGGAGSRSAEKHGPGGLVYPLYVYPTAAAVEGVYADVAKAAATVPTVVVINPDNGDQATCPPNSDWLSAIKVLKAGNASLIGYVHSSYGKRPLAEYRAEIAAYLQCWEVDGIFVDEAADTPDMIPYYKEVAAAVGELRPNASVWLNPGESTDHGYLEVADVLVQFESPDAHFQTYTPPPYVANSSDPGRCAMMVLKVADQARMEAVVKKIREDHCGWIIVLDASTSYTSPHPPTFWTDEVAAVSHQCDGSGCSKGAPAAAASNRSVDWWLGSYNPTYVDENAAFIKSHREDLTGVLHCCRGMVMESNGSLSSATATTDGAFFQDLTAFEVSAGLSPTMIPISPNTEALLNGVADKAIPGLVAVAVARGFSGYVVDYEPHANLTSTHAKLLGAWLEAMASALHASKKELAVCVSDWGIIGPLYYNVLAAAGADRYVSMGSTYGNVNNPAIKLNVEAMVLAFPLESITVGIGTIVPAACNCVYGNTGNCTGNYGWTEASLTDFVQWVAGKGIDRLAIWRADIYPKYCSPSGVESFFFPILTSFLKGAI